ncbi:MAG TPA: hypothetical protein VL654_04335, partial [Casimicrobiaceae bacterium]|nr:hypothetical protein [Casimicrobiaceae bacterium]
MGDDALAAREIQLTANDKRRPIARETRHFQSTHEGGHMRHAFPKSLVAAAFAFAAAVAGAAGTPVT